MVVLSKILDGFPSISMYFASSGKLEMENLKESCVPFKLIVSVLFAGTLKS